jgi:hypothetical protein
MNNITLEIQLMSDTTFSIGGGVSGLVDAEVQHDELGLPTISGRALKGVLVNECADIINSLPSDRWKTAALCLFGKRGEVMDEPGGVWIGDAGMPPDLVTALRNDKNLLPGDILDSLTSIRTQTAMDEMGTPKEESLRSIRVVLRKTMFFAPVLFADEPSDDEKALLAASVMALRRAGLGRRRGKGKIHARLTDRPLDPHQFAGTAEQSIQDLTIEWFKLFKEALV